ncbi:MAG: amidohydrolase family protein, partial [Gemmatimonadales bacterium]|nr:amidohydrolase family protein [Gemmatimonadales bacterium]
IPYLRDFSPDDYREAGRGVGAQRRMVRELDRAGAGLLLGTDSYLQGFALEAELAEFEAAGIDRGRILTIATANAATFLGESDRWGRIAVGQRADLQLLDADPVADLAALDRRAGVMVAGRWLSKADLAERLERLRARP